MGGLELRAQYSGLSFNPAKCKLVVFGLPAFFRLKQFMNMDCEVRVRDTPPDIVSSFKYLGVRLDRSFSWRKQALV